MTVFKLNEQMILHRSQLKEILGGSQQAASCTADCGGGDPVTCEGEGTCTAVDGTDGFCTINGKTSYCNE